MSHTHLTENERYVISHLKVAKFSLREIGRRLGRHHTSIMREIARNGPTYPDGVYWYTFTHGTALKRRHQPRSFRRQDNADLVAYVEEKLMLDWPPEAIAARLKMDFPMDRAMRISHETIYRWIYLDAREGGELHKHLRRRRRNRRRQTRYCAGRRFIPGRVSIKERPAVVGTRERFGDWEGDTLHGAKGAGNLATYVERKSRFLLAARLADRRAATMTDHSARCFSPLPEILCQTVTVDNGSEFAEFKDLETKTGLTVYFADPYASWQRGTNENTNGILRHYFPKGFDFRTLSEEEIQQVVKQVNDRPRKCLGYRTPAEVLRASFGGAFTT
ncbi:IS30 family transposase [Geomonas sp. RF6]|uniref:IS30 family transposase n=1 Tax=Geomonas sp. RF6 TaxID=2897342 RepID=UPI001E4F2B6B|nr:IS30 family transposase [Geomonas sp. RF6]UFS68870.1 IS30 family transposase [Geomonas sp. RF6]UFS69297.1 IS30 family transposase [Geomonas sp. RF6]UFS70253.1 IS30 family transposase [Geomonas sp. RF6]UFS70709.1 IS30 family transposase [Geomonas sp. RF6]UFS71392.1 IS30 family transposase [Geomonas sp. RF6]